jgi:hypothetical protein
MPKFFFHLRDGADLLLDPDGTEIPEEALAGAALSQARDCIAGDVHHGRIRLDCRIDVHAEDGRLVHSLPFVDAVEIELPA